MENIKLNNLKQWLKYSDILNIESSFSSAGNCSLFIKGMKISGYGSGGYGYDKTINSLSRLINDLILNDVYKTKKSKYNIYRKIESSSYYSLNVDTKYFSIKQITSLKNGDLYQLKIKQPLKNILND